MLAFVPNLLLHFLYIVGTFGYICGTLVVNFLLFFISCQFTWDSLRTPSPDPLRATPNNNDGDEKLKLAGVVHTCTPKGIGRAI